LLSLVWFGVEGRGPHRNAPTRDNKTGTISRGAAMPNAMRCGTKQWWKRRTELTCDVCRRGWHSFVSTLETHDRMRMAALEMWRPDHLIRQAVATASTATHPPSTTVQLWAGGGARRMPQTPITRPAVLVGGVPPVVSGRGHQRPPLQGRHRPQRQGSGVAHLQSSRASCPFDGHDWTQP
jgi:hypothetical protein